MTTPRSPTTATSRKVNETSFEEDDGEAKVQRVEAEQPPWALLLKTMEEIKLEQRSTNTVLESIVKKVTVLEEKVAVGEEGQARMEEIVQELRLENATLRGECDRMRGDLNKQIDSDLREHLIFYGVSGYERTWELSAQRLAKWLAENVGGKTEEQFDENIWRCHRGPAIAGKAGPRPLFVKLNYRYVDRIRSKFMVSGGSVNGVTIREQYCDDTQGRVNEALAYRKEWKSRNPNSSAYVKFPAILKVKGASDTSYRVEKSF